MDTDQLVRDYFSSMNRSYQKYGGRTRAMHIGLTDGSSFSPEESLIESNRILVDGIEICSGMRILDAGCGMGGLAIYLASRFKVHVTGIDLCPHHVELATRFALEEGVADLVDFRCLDFMNLRRWQNEFDLILNQESYCYVKDRAEYLRGIYESLKPGGTWCAFDAFLNPSLRAEDFGGDLIPIEVGWRTQPFGLPDEMIALLGSCEFERSTLTDHSKLATQSAGRFIFDQIHLGIRSGLEKEEIGVDPNFASVMEPHLRASAQFGAMILDGRLTYQKVKARKPLSAREVSET